MGDPRPAPPIPLGVGLDFGQRSPLPYVTEARELGIGAPLQLRFGPGRPHRKGGHLPVHQQISPTPLQRMLIAVVIVGALLVAGVAFTGSYVAVRDLAASKGFGAFSVVFPIGIDCGILVVLALDVLLTWLRCPFPLLRHTAWLLTGATIAFNAALWPDPLGAAMHAALPVIFTVTS